MKYKICFTFLIFISKSICGNPSEITLSFEKLSECTAFKREAIQTLPGMPFATTKYNGVYSFRFKFDKEYTKREIYKLLKKINFDDFLMIEFD